MKKGIYFAMFITLFLGYGCQKETPSEREEVKSTLSLSLVTKGSGTQSEMDNTINTLEVFIFYNEEGDQNYGKLESYSKILKNEITSLQNIGITSTVGPKKIYILANSHRSNWSGTTNLSLFQKEITSLEKENEEDFVLVGNSLANFTSATSNIPITIILKRIVARVELLSIKTSFSQSPFAGKKLENASVYLINAIGEKYYHNGEKSPSTFYNLGGINQSDLDKFTNDIIYKSITNPIGEGVDAMNSPIQLYCYGNSTTTEDASNKYTKLVIECTLDGIKYYYPIALPGILNNQWYRINATILRPGSLSPNETLEKGSINISMSIADWDESEDMNVEF